MMSIIITKKMLEHLLFIKMWKLLRINKLIVNKNNFKTEEMIDKI
jgi:hypothetical protein